MEETLPAIIKRAEVENSVALFGDEVSFAMWGSLARTWAPIGQQPTVKTTGKIILIEDGAPYHGSNVVKDFKSANVTHLTIERLPAFSPDYNPIEKLWKNTKCDSTHMKYFKTFEDLLFITPS